MKTTVTTLIIVFLSILASSFSAISAEPINKNKLPVDPAKLVICLAPVTPVEATFDEETIHAIPAAMLAWCAPETPSEASFDEGYPEVSLAEIIAAPVTPKEATFDDEYIPFEPVSAEFLNSVAPETPKTADFND
ncbi:MAG: hypothetical protein Q8867_11200 [Bacteroidota bacterium]|nr:hypothetical protein [Bacteroidota bacterium]